MLQRRLQQQQQQSSRASDRKMALIRTSSQQQQQQQPQQPSRKRKLFSLRPTLYISFALLLLLLYVASPADAAKKAAAKKKKGGSSSSSKGGKGGNKKRRSTRSSVGPVERPKDKCDFSQGRWVADFAGPRYDKYCPFIPGHLNCQANQRTDAGYLFKRWQPANCSLPKFDSSNFLRLMEDKVMMFAGDSFSHAAMYTSLRCQLHQVAVTEDWAGLLWNKNSTGFRVRSVNFTAIYIRLNFLTFSMPADLENIRITDHWMVPYDWLSPRLVSLTNKANVAVFSTGMWWNQDPSLRILYRSGKADFNTTLIQGYQKMFKSLNDFFETDELFLNWKGVPFVLGYVPHHPSNSYMTQDTSCSYYTSPFTEEEEKYANAFNNLAPWDAAARDGVYDGKNLRFLDIYRLTNYRPDGHLGQYGFAGSKGDCLQYCLPGVPDTWLDVFYSKLLDEKVGTY